MYSIFAPIGTPLASRVILMSVPSKIRFIYMAVVSDSILGLNANIISLKLLLVSRIGEKNPSPSLFELNT